jgi:DNA-binding GntR family transcriptional regulator
MTMKKRIRKDISDELVAKILSGKFKPRERLIERNLVAEFGVSRTPIREAMRTLEKLGLVECFPNKGAVVKDFTPKDIEDLYFIRVFVEGLACMLSFSNLGVEEIRALGEINHELQVLMKTDNLSRLIEKDREFHYTIYKASGNDFLVQVIDELRLKSYIVSYYSWADQDQIKLSIAEHKGIIEALRQKNRDKFKNLVKQHIVLKKMLYLENLM